jgi:hypothetical protein
MRSPFWLLANKYAKECRRLSEDKEKLTTALCLANDAIEELRLQMLRDARERLAEVQAYERLTSALMAACPADASSLGDAS